ncbi:MAG TPA: hypothetical protein QGF58_12450 [Myxococcota bacterium]|nr:hypothetical protein [Myxococcota bacterium]
MWLLACALVLAEEEPIVARVGLAASVDKHSPLVGIHLAASNRAGPLRTGFRVDGRGWRYPTREEIDFWAGQGVSGLPDHVEWELTGAMGVRYLARPDRAKDWRGQPGVELGLVAGYWHYATMDVQGAYADLGAVKWPLEEARLGPEILVGLFSPADDFWIVYMHRAYLPIHARLDGEGGRYVIGDQTFEPVEVVNPILEAGLAAMAHRGVWYGQVEATWRLTMPSAKNRAVTQSPPDGTVVMVVSAGRAF